MILNFNLSKCIYHLYRMQKCLFIHKFASIQNKVHLIYTLNRKCLLFSNFRSMFIIVTLSDNNHFNLFYANVIFVFSKHKFLEDSITEINSALNILSSSLHNIFLEVAPEKGKFIMFTRNRLNYFPPVLLNGTPLQICENVKYLGMVLDPKLG